MIDASSAVGSNSQFFQVTTESNGGIRTRGFTVGCYEFIIFVQLIDQQIGFVVYELTKAWTVSRQQVEVSALLYSQSTLRTVGTPFRYASRQNFAFYLDLAIWTQGIENITK